MRVREPRWARFAKAAVGEMAPTPPQPLRARVMLRLSDLQRRIADAQAARAQERGRRRADIRLLPAVLGSCAAAAAATTLPKEIVGACVLLLTTLLFAAVLKSVLVPMSIRAIKLRNLSLSRSCSHSRTHSRTRSGSNSRTLTLRYSRWTALFARAGPTMALTAICVLAVLGSASLRTGGAGTSPLHQVIARGGDFVLTLQLESAPRLLAAGNGPPRVAFDALVISIRAGGEVFTGTVPVRVVAGSSWAVLMDGDRAVTAGTISTTHGSGTVAGFLRTTTAPQEVIAAAGGPGMAVTKIRNSWIAAVQNVWTGRSEDTAGLLPGMVMGDRGGMGSGLEEAMKTVGLTHLTAVSGANCTLVLASIMLGLRSLRIKPSVAFALSGAGLLGFVMVVGPDPSVLRAAVMGSIGAMAVLGGRPKRVGALLCVTIVALLVANPWLVADYAFILSVLATLGLHLIGQRCVRWLGAMLPLWLAQAIAIPLAAQLFCAPVIVLLQARLTPYTIPANMLAAPVVALVTTVGTLGMVMAALIPPVAALCAAVSGAGAWWVATVARTMAALPASSVPWPAGLEGFMLMSVLNGAVLAALFAVVEKERAIALAGRLRALLPARWRGHEFGVTVGLVMAATAWWSAAVLLS
ncbi:ComEC/Rec2 family competence protein [Arthrobacter psychrochitiniphilus]|uniref:ComEC/Rec2-related protein domain-containing protein n=1 Tax=Arthrobacter psychrochitiniphilus TaxID=291045 RepID=A0A2V3DQH9_9MICC|nr:ComEC/Rec2 family competence protein [Arthrobacter psychrochitiniphilus]NYG17674.1 competence protein ComEC [Arthrobacter psychrochitiniphilus]PXA65262.1 hypothetical protein CVS29_11390 [Arthrobacter psychrochitiniphilus]